MTIVVHNFQNCWQLA